MSEYSDTNSIPDGGDNTPICCLPAAIKPPKAVEEEEQCCCVLFKLV